jgi:hypothetical protein
MGVDRHWPDQLSKMHRRDLLKLLSASATIPLGGIDLLWNSAVSPVSNTTLSHLEGISTVLAGQYQTARHLCCSGR